ncbi:MAG: hypothetical protein HYX69_14470 [Planctomycetia bacterium]|nr:hypothetical protein [Planctomycetia bacterium]
MHALLCTLALLAVGDEKYQAWVSGLADVKVLPASAGERLSATDLAALAKGSPVMPYDDATVAVRTKDGAVWAGSKRGLMYLAPGASRWRLFHSRMWLPSDDVQNLAITEKGACIVQTPAGFASVRQEAMTLDRKMAAIDDTLQKHHVRFGLVGEINMKEPGNLAAGHVQGSSDNDGLWTSMYVAAEAFRYGTTHDPAAKKNARRSLDALMFLERVSGIPGFVARSIVPIEDEQTPKHGGEWHRSADNKWWWKGDTSSDELDGHYFAYAVYYDLAADDAEKKEIAQYVARITDHILDHGLYYVGPPGKPTTWGVWAPEKLNHDLQWLGDRGLNSLEILSHLKAAEHIVGNPRYAQAAKDLIEKHSYEINTVEQKLVWPPEAVNHSDDELAFLAYYPLVIYERDPALRKVYMASIRRSWRIERPEHSPFLNFIYGAALQANTWSDPSKRPDAALVEPASYDRDECVEYFRDVPQDTTVWTVKNSGRQDLGGVATNRFRQARGLSVLPISERRVMKWNGDPYEFDGGSEGRERDDGTFILLPYWMGRYHRLIE